MTSRTIAVVSAGLSEPSSTRLLADRLTQAVRDGLLARGVGADVRVHGLREHAHDITDAMLTGFAPAGLQAVIDDVVAADGLVVATPIFTASYSGLFKSFIDVLDPDGPAVGAGPRQERGGGGAGADAGGPGPQGRLRRGRGGYRAARRRGARRPARAG